MQSTGNWSTNRIKAFECHCPYPSLTVGGLRRRCDITEHRKQAPERIFFFPTEDPEALADSVQTAYNGFESNAKHPQGVVSVRLPEGQRKLAETDWDIMKGLSEDRISTWARAISALTNGVIVRSCNANRPYS